MKSENKTDRKKRIPLKWSVFLCFAVFTGLIILLMWLGQSVFLEKIYKGIKIREIRSYAQTLTEHADSSDMGSAVDSVAQNNVCVVVFNMDAEEKPILLYSNHVLNSCVIHSIDSESFGILYNMTQENGGEQLQRFMFDSSRRRYIGIAGDFFEKSPAENGDFPESIIYSVLCENGDGEEIFIVLNSTISPVGATVNTLNILLAVITVILIILALIMALIISRRISRPITRLTASAKELALGNYNVNFDHGNYREISELSDALNYAEEELAKTDGLRRELIANVSHDLRTPLTMITGYSEAIRDLPGENTPENVQVIIDEAKRLSSLVDDLLDVSRLESGVGKNQPALFDLTSAVGTTLARFSKLCEKDGYTLEFFSEGTVFVTADEQRITQALYNLVANALTHTGEDKRVTVTESISGGRVRVSVADTGEGIPADKLPLIWDRYYKVDRVHKRSAAGSGLGLSIVKRVMELNNGSYGVASKEGEGSVFWIELPVDRPADGEETSDD